MSLRGPYNTQKRPPAPFVPVTIGDPVGGSSTPDVPAQIDTAADYTVVPQAVVQGLGLEPVDELVVGGFGGTVHVLPLYLVSLAVRTFPPKLLRIVAHPDEPWMLLGRDVLNGHRLVLDGPNLTLELS